MPLDRHDRRTPRQQRAAALVGPIVLATVGAFLVAEPLLGRLLPRGLGTPATIALVSAPIVALYRYAIDGRPARRALLEGLAAALGGALLYWWVFIRPLPEPWWLER